VTHAGLRVGGQPLEAWLAFACTAHAAELVAPRELLDRDRALLADWADRERRALAGEGWDPPKPLAVGSAARALERRAIRPRCFATESNGRDQSVSQNLVADVYRGVRAGPP
jgi:hypothetical protein